MLRRVERPAIQPEVHFIKRHARRQILHYFEQHLGKAFLECCHPQPASLAGLKPHSLCKRTTAPIQQRGDRVRLHALVIVQRLRQLRLAAGQFVQQPGVRRPPQRAEDWAAAGGSEGEEEGKEHGQEL